MNKYVKKAFNIAILLFVYFSITVVEADGTRNNIHSSSLMPWSTK